MLHYGPPAKGHSNGVSLVSQKWPVTVCWMGKYRCPVFLFINILGDIVLELSVVDRPSVFLSVLQSSAIK